MYYNPPARRDSIISPSHFRASRHPRYRSEAYATSPSLSTSRTRENGPRPSGNTFGIPLRFSKSGHPPGCHLWFSKPNGIHAKKFGFLVVLTPKPPSKKGQTGQKTTKKPVKIDLSKPGFRQFLNHPLLGRFKIDQKSTPKPPKTLKLATRSPVRFPAGFVILLQNCNFRRRNNHPPAYKTPPPQPGKPPTCKTGR